MISAATFMCFELVGAAALALWVVARLPRLGPTSLRGATAAGVVALGLLQLLELTASLLLRLPHGAYFVLLALGLGLFATFLAAAWFLRVLAAALPGSGGGPGHRVPSR